MAFLVKKGHLMAEDYEDIGPEDLFPAPGEKSEDDSSEGATSTGVIPAPEPENIEQEDAP
jgi:hypothetical protein